MLRSGKTATRRGRRATAYAVVVMAGLLPATAGAQGTGGAGMPVESAAPSTEPAAAKLGTTPFGVRPIRPAKLRSVRCLTGCADTATPLTDARLRLRGRGLRRAE